MIEFAALPMLISLAAAAIPYLLLRNRLRTKKTVYWSANRLLEQAAKSQARKMDWLRWLLLALRTLALVCLALAVANPFWKLAGSAVNGLDASASLYCYVIDCSPSMTLKEGDQPDSDTNLVNALRSIRDEVSRLGNHELICVITLDDSAQVRFLGDRTDQSLLAVLDDVRQSAVSVNSLGMESTIEQVIDQSRQRSRTLKNVYVKIMSDFSAHDWSTEQLAQFSKQLASRINGLLVHTEFVVAQQAQAALANPDALPPIRNLSLCKLSFREAAANESTGYLRADISNTGTVPTAATAVQLWVANQLNSSLKLPALAVGETLSVEFNLGRRSDSDIKAEVRLPDDQLAMDNVGFHILERALPIRAVLIGSDESTTLGLSVAYQSLGASVSVESSVVTLEQSAAVQDIHLVNPVVLDAKQLENLSQSALDGNHVFVWMGNGLPVTALERIDSIDIPARRFTIADWPTSDLAPIIDAKQPTADAKRSTFTIPLNKYWTLETLRTGWQNILELGNSDPFALQRTVGRGSFTWIVTPPLLLAAMDGAGSNESAQMWNAMARWPSFVPLVDFLRNAAAHTTNRNYLAGQNIICHASANDSLEVERPDLTKTIQYMGQQGNLAFEADQLGWYSVTSLIDRSKPAMDFASNLDCREIEFRSVNLPSELQPSVPLSKDFEDNNFAKRPLFRAFLMICLSFLIMEMIVTSMVSMRGA